MTLQPSESLTLSVTGVRLDGTSTPVTGEWTATGGSIDDTGTFVAGATPGQFQVIVTLPGGSLADTAGVTITAAAPTLQAIELAPHAVTLTPGADMQFSAVGRMSDGTRSPVSITYSATGGSITSGGFYRAGTATGTFRVIATEQAGTDADTSIVVITAPTGGTTLTAVALTPASVSLRTGATQQFNTVGRLSDGQPTSVMVTYSATGGSITAGGLYTAGTTAGTYRVIAVRQGDTKADTSSVTITSPAPTLTAVDVTPAAVNVALGATRQFTALGRMSNGSATRVSVTWSATGGAITAGGLYTAGSTAGTFRVIAVRQGDTKADTARVSITAAAPTLSAVEVTPATVSLATEAKQQFTARGRMSDGSPSAVSVTYSATGGTISSGGLYTAGSTAGSYRLIAVQQGGTRADTSAVTVTASPAPAPPPPPPPPPATSAFCDPYTPPTLGAAGRTFYVDASTGNDGNAGSASAPWRTLGRANGAVQAGDWVYLRGTFSGQWLNPGQSGTASARIVYAVWPGASAVLSGGQYDAAILLENGRSYVVVDGLEVTNVANPVLVRGGAHHNWLRNLKVHDAGSSILTGATDNRLEGSRFERIGDEAANAGEALYVTAGAARNLILRNQFVSAGHGAIWVSYQSATEPTSDDNIIAHNDIANPWASGLGLNGTANRTLVECNTIHHTANGSRVNYARDGIEVEGTNNIIRFNVIHSIGASGLSLEGRTFGGRVQNARGNHIYHNTFYGMGDAAVGLVQRDVGVVQNNIIENNIFWQAAGLADGGTRYAIVADQYNANSGNSWSSTSASGNVVRNNVVPTGQSLLLLVRNGSNGGNVAYTSAQAASTLGWTGNLGSDPQLTAAPSDVTLRSTSPAIDAGKIISGVTYLGAAPDIGSKERQ